MAPTGMPFEFSPMPELPEVVLVKPRVFHDPRGWFSETYKASDFAAAGIPTGFRQDNHSRSVGRGAVRGLHYQKSPMAQGKLVRCVRGEALDVAVDIRKGSPTYGRHVAAVLSAENHHMLWVPVGFAHGFCTLTEEVDILYKCTEEYSRDHDRSILWNDPALAIPWPLKDPVLSEKDARAPRLAEADNDFVFEAPAR